MRVRVFPWASWLHTGSHAGWGCPSSSLSLRRSCSVQHYGVINRILWYFDHMSTTVYGMSGMLVWWLVLCTLWEGVSSCGNSFLIILKHRTWWGSPKTFGSWEFSVGISSWPLVCMDFFHISISSHMIFQKIFCQKIIYWPHVYGVQWHLFSAFDPFHSE